MNPICLTQVLGNFSNAQRIITGKTSCIGIDYQVGDND